MTLYDDTEINRIEKMKKTNETLEKFFEEKRSQWSSNLSPLFETIKTQFTLNNAPKIIEVQSLALSYRQSLSEEISLFMNKRSKEAIKIKKIKQDKFVFYATGFGLKTNLGEKALLIDAHIAEYTRNTELIETHIEFLRSCIKNLETLGFTIKNIIELHNYLAGK